MCMRCDGYSWEEIARHTDLAIRIHGFTTVHVESERPWTYTVGALESWDQPELIVVDIDATVQKALIQAVGGEYVELGEIRSETLELLDVELITVDASHFADGLVAAWEGHYSMAASTGDFVQLVPGSSWFWGDRGPVQRRLDEGRRAG